MKILIVSDSHGRTNHLERVIDKVGTLDLFIHLGDVEDREDYIQKIVRCETAMVSGNNDYFTSLERELIIQIGRYTALLTHGHRYQVNYGTEMIRNIGIERGVDIVMYGHTHKPYMNTTGAVTLINPGSISQPRQEGHIPTYILMELDSQGQAHYNLKYVR